MPTTTQQPKITTIVAGETVRVEVVQYAHIVPGIRVIQDPDAELNPKEALSLAAALVRAAAMLTDMPRACGYYCTGCGATGHRLWELTHSYAPRGLRLCQPCMRKEGGDQFNAWKNCRPVYPANMQGEIGRQWWLGLKF